MSIAKKIGMSVVLSLLFLVLLGSVMQEKAYASGTTQPVFHFEVGGKDFSDGAEIKLKNPTGYISVVDAVGASPDTVEWETLSPGVVSLGAGTNYYSQLMTRKGPGYATITARITSGGYKLSISCNVWVDLEIDQRKTPLNTALTTGAEVLELKNVGDKKTIYLKFIDYDADPVTPVSGAAVTAGVMFESSNVNVATVDPLTGEVTAVGSGSSEITITSTTMSGDDDPLTKTLRVLVTPKFSITLNPTSGPPTVKPSVVSTGINDPGNTVDKVKSNFTINSEAKNAADLTWIVYDCSTNPRTKLDDDSAKLTYDIIEGTGNVDFTNVKAGTYEIYALSNEDYTLGTGVDKAYMKIVVPIDIGNLSITMQVNDTYELLENTNIPSANTFNYTSSEPSVISVDIGKAIFTAHKRGVETITCTLNGSLDLFSDPETTQFVITVRVIDSISLSMTNATINTKGTLQLIANVTNSKIPIVWKSGNTKIATVVDGLVTGVSDGPVIITAQQTIDGVVKSATCNITVQKSVDTITLSPDKITLAIGASTTIVADVTPKDLANITLQWKSSDESVVIVEKPYPLTAVITALKGGNAVISAINQDNVVVGYTHVSVRQPVTRIDLSEPEITIDLKTSWLQLRATVVPENALNKNVKWRSTDTSVADVDQNGLVTIKKAGKTSIIATSEDSPAVTAVCNLTVNIPVASIALDETAKTMYVGQASRLTYVILPTNASNSTVTWLSTNTSVATVDKTGLVVAKNVGSAVIILKTLENGQTIYCTITVKRVATGIKLDATTLNLKAGQDHIFKPTLTPNDSTDKAIVWESSDTKIATVDDEGKVVAKSAGSTIIVAKLESGATAYCKVNVTLPVTGLLLNFTDKSIYVGEKFKLKVSVTPSSATQLGVTWKSSNTSIATINEDGEVTGLAGGTAIITCTTKDGGYSDTCVINVLEAVSSIAINYQTYYLGVDKSVFLVATVTTPTATNKDVYWSSSNPDIATVNQKGKVVGRKLGFVTITATSLDGTEVEASCEVQVVNPTESVSLNKTTISLLVGQTKKLKATIAPNNATIKTPRWSSSDPSVAIVDEDGEVIAIKAGSTTITAEAGDNSGKKALCYVTVYDRVASTGITLQDKTIVMLPGEEKIVQMVLIPSASTDDTTWSSDNNAVARVDKDTGKITARATGVAYITVMTDSGKTAQVEVIVIGLNITEITLEEYTNFSTQLQVEGASSRVTWSIDNPLVAEVTNGFVSSRGKGKATITAFVNGRRLTCKLKVVKIGSN
ncbi:MAG: hypothetical protein K0R34_1239 [Herbinix sp.]|jgi:uncharacterized protein YjdB|nr:hypothetical protein [Herbinix sp.]